MSPRASLPTLPTPASLSSSLRTAALVVLLVALAAPLAWPTPYATAAEDEQDEQPAPVTVSGVIHHQLDHNGGRADAGFAEFYDADSAELVASTAADGAGEYALEVPPGSYIVALYNSADGVHFTDHFPELYKEHPLFSGKADIVTVEADTPLTIDGNLRPMFFDMFDSPFDEDIFFMGNTGITRGCNPEEGNTLYCPDGTVTRGQMAAFIVRAFDLTETDESVDFEDIADSPFRSDIRRLATADITRGCNPDDGNTRFCPDDDVTRGEMAAFLVRAFGMSEISDDVAFTDTDDSIFEDDILRLATADVTRGCNPPDNDRYCPTDPVTRGEMAAFLRRAFQWLGAEMGAAAFTAPGEHGDTGPASRPDLTDRTQRTNRADR